MNDKMCRDCELRMSFATRKFIEGEGYMGFSGCAKRRNGFQACFDEYCDYIRQFKLGVLKPRWPSLGRGYE